MQLVFRASDYQDGSLLQSYTVSVKGAPVPAELYLVELLPSDFHCWENAAALCRKSGIQYLKIAHLFTQWGAYAAPKIMACVDGEMKRIFGWDVPADSPAYREFLESFLSALKASLEEMGYDREHVYFHISDEPSEEHMDSYLVAKRQVLDLLEGYPVIDALSSFSFYQKGIVKQSVPANDHIQPFLDARVPGLWVYYCCCQGVDVPNRFYAMPSQRNRIMGVLMYLHRIEGFLHWGHNFYYTQFSRRLADPYRMTHADYAFSSGDAYLVYPGEGGMPLTSNRAEVQSEGLADIRILDTLEQKKGVRRRKKSFTGKKREGSLSAIIPTAPNTCYPCVKSCLTCWRMVEKDSYKLQKHKKPPDFIVLPYSN